MKRFLKVLKAILLIATTAAANYDPNEYYEGDVAVINALIENNGLDALIDTPTGPNGWEGRFVRWSSETPRRIVMLSLHENRNLTGDAVFSGLEKLENLHLCNNQLTSIDVSGLENLEWLSVRYNELTSIDVSGLERLEHLDLTGNRLSSIDMPYLENLMRLWISDNELTSIDVSRLKNLESLVLSNNQLTSIDVSGLENLTGLFLGNNQLTSIDVSGLEKLVRLNLDNNQLTSIDISGLENLTELTLWYNFINSQDDVIGLDPNNLNTIGALLFQRLMSHVGFSLSQYLYTYDGSPKIPVVSVSFGLIELEEGTDFSLRYEDNINAGTARIILTGMNNFRGERVIEFTIRKVQKEWIPVPAITKEFSEGLTLGDIELPESYSWKHPEWLLWIFSEAIEFEAVLASNNVNHYDAIGKISVTITEQGVSIANMNRNDSRYGIRFTQNPVSDKAEISVILPNNEASTGSATEIVIFDMTGNVVFNRRGDPCGRPIIWDLRNTSGRFVANGTYLVIAEVKDRSGNTHRYSARLGVKR